MVDPATRRRAVIRDSLGVGIATGTYGATFGAVSVGAGLDVLQTCALSLLMFTGASQFALVGTVAAGGAPWSGAATALLLGTRNTLYGLRIAPLLGWSGWRRAAGAHLLLDETTAMSVSRETDADARAGYLTTGITIFVLWNASTLLGAVAGTVLGDPRALGLDAAVGAAFLALLWPQLGRRASQVVAVLAVTVALGLVPVAAAGVPVLAAGGVALVAGALVRDVERP